VENSDPGPAGAAGAQHEEFLVACRRLAAAGYPVRDPEQAWPCFARHRREYAPALAALARQFAVPPFQWLGADRLSG
jgi:hypothetical protein